MTTRIEIQYRGKKGYVSWDNGEISADIPGEAFVTAELREHLDRSHRLRIPQSSRIDDYKLEHRRAKNTLEDFEQILSRLWSDLGIWVNW